MRPSSFGILAESCAVVTEAAEAVLVLLAAGGVLAVAAESPARVVDVSVLLSPFAEQA
jgi:hypothetical protein